MKGSVADAVLPFRRNPWFWAVLGVKLAAAALFGSHYVRDLFVPFVSWFVDSGFANPYDHFAAQGQLDAFPYSGLMLVLLAAPQALADAVLPAAVTANEPVRLLLVRLPMLAADLAILAVLARWFPTRRAAVLLVYWCSPILFYISYVHGQVDSIPSAFLILSLFQLLRRRPLSAGVLLGLGLGTKFHLLVALPFVLVLLWKRWEGDRFRGLTVWLGGAVAAVAVTVGPLVPSPGYRQLVLATSETRRLFALAAPFAEGLVLYVAPAALLLLLLRFAAEPRVNRDLAVSFLAVVFSVLVLLVPPMPGWYFWSIPFAAYFTIRRGGAWTLPYWLVNALYVGYYALLWTDPATHAAPLVRTLPGGLLHAADPESLGFTALQTSVALLVLAMYRQGVRSARQYEGADRPVLVGVGGDSASGKHTLAATFRSLVGPAHAAQTEGDDYHRWERGDDAWRDVTHLHPRANRMFQPGEHLWALRQGRAVTKRVYDHETGRFSAPIRIEPRRLTLYVGLHPFFIRRMRNLFDLRIYLDPDEELRRAWKIARDHEKRGYTPEEVLAQIEARRTDAERFVHPQRSFADWIVAWRVGEPGDAAAPAGASVGAPTVTVDPAPLRASHVLRNDLPVEPLVAALSALEGVAVRWELHPDMERQVLEVGGPLPAAALGAIAFRLFPNLGDLLGTEDLAWQDGQLGLAQLLLVVFLDDALRASPRAPAAPSAFGPA